MKRYMSNAEFKKSEEYQRQKAFRAAAKQQAKDRKAKVVMMFDGGDKGIVVQYIDNNGEVVIGEFLRVGWREPPAAVAAQIQAALDSPPEYTVGI